MALVLGFEGIYEGNFIYLQKNKESEFQIRLILGCIIKINVMGLIT